MKKYKNRRIIEYAMDIKSTIKKESPEVELIDSPEKLNDFLKKEKLYKAKMRDQSKIIQKIAQDIVSGKRDIKIDLEKIPRTQWPNVLPDKREAEKLYWDLTIELKQMQNPTYGKTYQVFAKFIFWLQLILGLAAFLVDGKSESENNIKKKQFATSLKQLGDPSKKTPRELISWMKKAMSYVKM